MGNETSMLKLKSGKTKEIMQCPPPTQEVPLYRKRSKRSISQSRYAADRTKTPPEETIQTERKASVSSSARPSTDSLLLPPTSDRRRSRSLCAAQMEEDAQAVSSQAGTPPQKTSELEKIAEKGDRPMGDKQRKSSQGLVPALNRLRIQQCYKNAKPTIGHAILRRAATARPELRSVFARIPEDQMEVMGKQMFTLVNEAVHNMDKGDDVLAQGRLYGESFAILCPLGFRPDLFSPLADAAIAECVKLDGGMHKRCETLLAWSQLIGALFTSVRDGYYQRVRYQRRSSLPQHTISKQLSTDIWRSVEHQDSSTSTRS